MKSSKLIRFIITLSVLTLIIFGTGAAFFKYYPEYYESIYPFTVFVFYGITIIFFHFSLKALGLKPGSFVNRFMLFTTIKLLVYLFFIAGYLFFNREHPLRFGIMVIGLYMFFTVYEVFFILRVLKSEGKK